MLAHVGSKLSYVGSMLAHVGPMLAHVGPMLAHVGPMLALFHFFGEDMQDKQNMQNPLKHMFFNCFAMFLKVVGIQFGPMLAHAGSYLAYACLFLP